MSIDDQPRWFELSDGTLTARASIYDALNYTQEFETLGGDSVLRMMSGAAIKQTNWQKLMVSLSGNGGLPFGFTDLDYSLPITIKCGAPRAIVRPTNAFTVPPNSRVDVGYTSYVLKFTEGYWLPLTASGTAEYYKLLYYPQLVCFMRPPKESYAWDGSPPTSWSLVAEEI